MFISVCGEGFGHASRGIAIAKEMELHGHKICIACYGTTLERIKKEEANGIPTYPELKMTGKNGAFNLAASIAKSASAPANIARAIIHEKKIIEKTKTDIVISDSRLSTVLAGKLAKKPVFYVCNQNTYPDIHFKESKNMLKKIQDKIKRLNIEIEGKLVGSVMESPLFFADKIIIADFKGKDAICYPLVSNKKEYKKKTLFLGPISKAAIEKTNKKKWESKQKKILVSFGGQKYREGFYKKLIEKAKKMEMFDFLFVSMFTQKELRQGNLQLKKFVSNLLEWMNTADLLVMPGGHSGIMESIILKKPSLIIPDKNQQEQLSNAKIYKKKGLGEMLELKDIELFEKKLELLSKNRKKHLKKLSRLSKLAKTTQNGAQNIRQLCEKQVEEVN